MASGEKSYSLLQEKLWPLVKKVIVFYKKSYSLF